MAKLKEVMKVLENSVPVVLQEDYDNSGLLVYTGKDEIKSILITLDITKAVVDEAVDLGADLIISHHPVIFRGIKKIDTNTDTGKALQLAIKNDINIYAIHTNLDNVMEGVNGMIAARLGLSELKILLPKESTLRKLVTYGPPENSKEILNALHNAGAGVIGDYRRCSYRSSGTGSYMPGENANPYAGTIGNQEEAQEERLELQFPAWKEKEVIEALLQAHPYEEVAYFIDPVINPNPSIGSGLTGNLENPMNEKDFLIYLKEKLQVNMIKYTSLTQKTGIHKVALCGGSGSFLIRNAIGAGAEAFITADIRYHDFFLAEGKILLADIGHYESEISTKDLLYNLINKKISNIALHLSEVNTNPVHYI